MADLISIHTYGHPGFLSTPSMMSRPNNHRRSLSSGNRSPSPGKAVTKMKSTNNLSDFRVGRRHSPAGLDDLAESEFNTLRDPRIASTSDLSKTSDSDHHPDLSNEVAALSVKLVQAINNQTTLDDSLTATRQELEQAQDRLQVLESENDKFQTDITSGVMLKRNEVESEILSLKKTIAEERALRLLAEKDKKNIEQELEALTAALFEEANKMVAAAKQEREAVEKKNEQLRAQIKDTELLVASQKEQLVELKSVMQEMNSVRDETDNHTNASTAPSSPAVAMQANLNRLLDTSNFSPVSVTSGDISPAPSTSFPYLIRAVCRTDINAHDDFSDLLHLARSSKPPSRVASGSYGGLNVMGLGSLTGNGSNGSTSSLNPGNNKPQTPNGSPQPNATHFPLKDTRFYKRILTEDIEPALRLDAAPSISWLTRRSVLSSICEGSLIVEPMPASARKYAFSCSLCGECRKGTENERTHRFRTSDSETAQRYALCMLCLEKVRACCEFAGYLRMILDGHVHVGDNEEEMEAWEETIRLRERIFWSRLGGGVVPTFIQTDTPDKESPVPVSSHQAQQPAVLGKKAQPPPLPPRNGPTADPSGDTQDPFVSDAKRVSIGGAILSADKANGLDEHDGADAEAQLRNDLNGSLHESADVGAGTTAQMPQSQGRPNPDIESKTETSMPGAFDL